jgi:hypothetical protein
LLPDDRYRIYLVIGRGKGREPERFLVRELYVREGKPVDREEAQPKTTRPATAAGASDEAGSNADAASAASEMPAAEPVPALPAGDAGGPGPETSIESPPQDSRQVQGSALLPAGALLGAATALWHTQVDEAIEKHGQRLRSKAARFLRRRSPK